MKVPEQPHSCSTSVVDPTRVERPKLKVPIPARYDLLAQDWLTSAEIEPLLKDLALEFPELYINKHNQVISNYSEIQEYIIGDLDTLKVSPENDQKKFIAYPLNINQSHWTLIFINREKQTIEYYDSMVNYGPYKKIQSALKKVTEVLNENDESYSLIFKMTKAVQDNGKDCGPWILYFTEERVSKGPDFTTELQKLKFTKTSALMKNYRKEISTRAYVYKLKMDVFRCEKNLKQVEEEGEDLETVNEYHSRLIAAKEEYKRAIE